MDHSCQNILYSPQSTTAATIHYCYNRHADHHITHHKVCMIAESFAFTIQEDQSVVLFKYAIIS